MYERKLNSKMDLIGFFFFFFYFAHEFLKTHLDIKNTEMEVVKTRN